MRLDQLNSSEQKLETILENLEENVNSLQRNLQEEVRIVKAKFDMQIVRLSDKFNLETEKLRKQAQNAEKYAVRLEESLEAYKRTLEREAKAENKKLKARIKELESFIDSIEFVEEEEKNLEEQNLEEEKEQKHFLRARTLAIFQKVLMMIGKWSEENSPAEDFEIVSRSILIPSVYMRISEYEPNYLLKDFPNCKEVVVNGRKYISDLRKEYPTNLSSKAVWDSTTEEVKIWWTDYALPEIFGWKDHRWEEDHHLDWENSNRWENNPTDQMRMFPPIYDTLYSLKSYDSLTAPMRDLSLELENKQYKF